MSEWASKIMSAVMPDRGKVDFDQYLTEVSSLISLFSLFPDIFARFACRFQMIKQKECIFKKKLILNMNVDQLMNN
jgi:hypothetical protein